LWRLIGIVEGIEVADRASIVADLRILPAFIMRWFGPECAGICRSQFHPEADRVIPDDPDGFNSGGRQDFSLPVLQTNAAFPGEWDGSFEIVRNSFDEVTSGRLGVDAEELPSEGQGIGLSPHPREPEADPPFAKLLPTFGLKVAGTPAEDSAGNGIRQLTPVVHVVAGQQQSIV
jgi:hypothetical protein